MTNQTPESVIAEAMVNAGAPLMHSRVEEGVAAALRATNMLREPGAPDAATEQAKQELAACLDLRAYWRGQSVKARSERDAATAATERVRAIHVRGTSSIGVDWCLDDHHKWPCPTIAALDEAPKPAEPEWEAEKQYRAIIGRPWNILDRKAPKDVPIFEATGPKNERVVHLQRSEETHAWVERWEERDVRLGPWVPVDGESKP